MSHPTSPEIETLCQELARQANQTQYAWPGEQLKMLGRAGVYRWFMPESAGGMGLSLAEILDGYIRISAACLTTAFILTQRSSACDLVTASPNTDFQSRYLEPLAAGEIFTTVGISNLTTSRQHLAKPVLRVDETADGYLLDGYSAWVTGGPKADLLVLGAVLENRQQVILGVPTDQPGIEPGEPEKLIALNASCTGPVYCKQVHVPRANLLLGPDTNVMAKRKGRGSGGLPTSALALGVTSAAIQFLFGEAEKRHNLLPSAEQLHRDWSALRDQLLRRAEDDAEAWTGEAIRARANTMVLNATQAALAAARGAGFVESHPAGRWCREALFFLVWSCPQPVLDANLCSLAGLSAD